MKHTIYLVPHTHYDAVWVFTKEDYFYINIDLILRKAIDLIQKSDYKFLIEQTALIEEIERRNPMLFKTMSRLIAQKRIEIADGEYLMADTMIPNGETLIREIMHGKRYVKDKFNLEVPVMWAADSFGYNAQLPQIYKKSGYKYFAFRRGADMDRPSEFWWEGLDGSRILAHWMPLGYRAGLDLSALEKSFDILRERATTKNILMPSGSGVTLPQSETSRTVKKWNRTHEDSRMKIATSREFFEALEEESVNLSVRRGELYSGKYSEVFPNVCSSRIWIKQNLRKHENMILACEKWATIAWLLGLVYPADEFGDNWRKLLWGAFHDVAPGTGIDECYDEARDNFMHLEHHLPKTLWEMVLYISRNLKQRDDVIIFNPLSWEVRNWVEVDLWYKRGKVKRIEGLRGDQGEIEVEILESTRYSDGSFHTVKIGFVATVPALGYRTYKIMSRNPRNLTTPRIRIKGNRIRNQFFNLQVDSSNGLIEVSQDGKLVVKGNELVLEEEIGDLYYHNQRLDEPLRTEGDQGIKYGKFRIKSFTINKTSLRSIINIESDYYSLRWPYRLTEKFGSRLWRHKYLTVKKKIIVYQDIPRIDIMTMVNNQHPQVRIRARFATDIRSSNYHSETQFGVVSRPVDQYHFHPEEKWVEDPCGVYPALNWIDYSDEDRGVTLINKGLPAHEIRDGEIYLTLLRSVLMLSSDGETGPAIPTPDAQEFKPYFFEYSLFPHQGGWKEANSFRPAYEFNHNLIGFQLPSETRKRIRTLPSSLSFIQLEPENLILTALKKAEGSNDVVLRLFETKGEKTAGVLNLFKEPKSVKAVNLLEEDLEEMECHGSEIRLEVEPFEIVTIKLRF
ncbi:MAG: glycoside hydrolase family 38 C-terminal domain-containing protein [Dehalococcoidales bacterium]